MIAVISPSKTLDFNTSTQHDVNASQPRLLKYAYTLIETLRKKTLVEIKDLMNISDSLANLNVDRYQNFTLKHSNKNAKPCAIAFRGDVYQELKAETFDSLKMNFAQTHLRILSGLYGWLRPLDLIHPYRLEMGVRLTHESYNTLYQYWDSKISELLLKDLKTQGDNIILNLSSTEYFTAINKKNSSINFVHTEFKDFKNGTYKVISFYAKKARGLMARYMIENQIRHPEDLKSFDCHGYFYDESSSSEKMLSFKRGG